jgi:hypothetical protein
VDKAEKYSWSSAKAHVKGAEDAILDKDCYPRTTIKDWDEYLRTFNLLEEELINVK